MSDDELNVGARKLAKITANDLIESLKGSIESGYMTYPELTGILRYFLSKSIKEMAHYSKLSKEELGLKELAHSLEKLERKENLGEKNKIYKWH